ncbi:PEGA domain-containing protein [Candidatus Francisella endociliophora]|nr:PEGA domain-containing protein [Francisella sp. FSC1006]
MKNIIKIYSVMLISLMLTSCASMYGDNDRNITVNSIPSGATVKLNGTPAGITPATFKIDGNNIWNPNITISKKGYKTESFKVTTSFQSGGLWNILTIWGFAIDAATGDMMKIDNKNITVTLTKE